jgi:serine/threonine protein kinase
MTWALRRSEFASCFCLFLIIVRVNDAGSFTFTSERPRGAYAAPEVLAGGAKSPAVDVFSCGCVIAFLFTGKNPFSGALELEAEAPVNIRNGTYDLSGLNNQPELNHLIEWMIAPQAEERPSGIFYLFSC